MVLNTLLKPLINAYATYTYGILLKRKLFQFNAMRFLNADRLLVYNERPHLFRVILKEFTNDVTDNQGFKGKLLHQRDYFHSNDQTILNLIHFEK